MKEEIASIIEQSNPSCGLKKACNTKCGECGAGRIIDLLKTEIEKMGNPYIDYASKGDYEFLGIRRCRTYTKAIQDILELLGE